jgi:hypothetical protein
MPRQIRTRQQIRELVSSVIHESRRVKEDAEEIGVPLPTRTEPDKTGCNWIMQYFRNARGYEDVIDDALRRIRAEVNLPEDE